MAPAFSRRTNWDTGESSWAKAFRLRREMALPLFDLTASNPTRCGFHYESEAILAPLVEPAGLDYEPHPMGLLSAREAVARYYADHDCQVNPDRFLLTTSTSEGYSFLFRLLCDPGDEVLIAQPSYPLFDFLADLDDVKLVPYSLFYDYGWHLDEQAIRSRVGPRTRAVAVVHPNNPTGHYLKEADRRALQALCGEHRLALIVDEVFLDYPLEAAAPEPSFASGEQPVLTFILSGMSKLAGLPQMKAAWIAVLGPDQERRAALERLEVIADTFLSMNAPVQHALPVWLAGREALREQIAQRTRRNLKTVDRVLAEGRVTRLQAEAGWSVVLRVPATSASEESATSLLKERGVAVHSGGFFGFRPAGFLVASLLTAEPEFERGLRELLSFYEEK